MEKTIIEVELEDLDFDGISKISLVDEPAIEEYFIKLSKEIKLQEIKPEKRMVTGAALVPDKEVYRNANGMEFYIVFREDTIRKAAELFMKQNRLNDTNLNHQLNVNNVTIVESWIIEDPEKDKAMALGMNLPKGTWMISMKIDNDKVWEMIKNDDIRGFSIEGFFSKMMQVNAMMEPEEEEETEDDKTLAEIKKLLDDLD